MSGFNETMVFDVASFSGNPAFGWGITAIIFLLTFLITFLTFKNFRRVIYGSIVNLILLFVYFLSRYIGTSAEQGDFEPLKYFAFASIWIIVAIIIGYFAEKTKFIKNLERKLRE